MIRIALALYFAVGLLVGRLVLSFYRERDDADRAKKRPVYEGEVVNVVASITIGLLWPPVALVLVLVTVAFTLRSIFRLAVAILRRFGAASKKP